MIAYVRVLLLGFLFQRERRWEIVQPSYVQFQEPLFCACFLNMFLLFWALAHETHFWLNLILLQVGIIT